MNKLKNIGKKDDGFDGDNPKAQWHLLPWKALREVVSVMQQGAAHYGENNWYKVTNWKKRYFSAALRHIVAYEGGEYIDPDSGLPHLAHAISCLCFILAKHIRNGKK